MKKSSTISISRLIQKEISGENERSKSGGRTICVQDPGEADELRVCRLVFTHTQRAMNRLEELS